MSDTINPDYLEAYSQLFAEKICTDYFGTKKYMDGQEIIQLTPCNQVNLMVIKTLFGAWQEELEKLKSNPFFDYKNYAVSEALKEFMNVLSRAIKVERAHFESLLKKSVQQSILLAVDPVRYFSEELDKARPDQVSAYLKEAKKYLKWHTSLLSILIEKAGLGASQGEMKRALSANYDYLQHQLEPAASLLATLDPVAPLQMDKLLAAEKPPVQPEEASSVFPAEPEPEVENETYTQKSAALQEEEPILENLPEPSRHRAAEGGKAIDPALAWAKFESEQYSYMKGSIGPLSESIALNQRFMFTKNLFDGNPDLMMHALKSVDQSESFVEAIEMLNQRFVAELDWDVDSEEVTEFLQLVFRKFGDKT